MAGAVGAALGVMLAAAVAFAGEISGVVTNPEKCLGVCALARNPADPLRPKEYPAAFDSTTGAFRIENLPAGAYDLRVKIPGGKLDGVDLRQINPDNAGPLTEADENAIREVIANLPPGFMQINRPIYIRGNASRAMALVEQVRCQRFHGAKPGEIIWRIEVWPFEQRTGAWVKSQAAPQVLCRIRVPREMPADEFAKLTWLFDPALGGIEITAEQPVRNLTVTIPDVSAAAGKAPGTVERQIEEYRKAHPEEP